MISTSTSSSSSSTKTAGQVERESRDSHTARLHKFQYAVFAFDTLFKHSCDEDASLRRPRFSAITTESNKNIIGVHWCVDLKTNNSSDYYSIKRISSIVSGQSVQVCAYTRDEECWKCKWRMINEIWNCMHFKNHQYLWLYFVCNGRKRAETVMHASHSDARWDNEMMYKMSERDEERERKKYCWKRNGTYLSVSLVHRAYYWLL